MELPIIVFADGASSGNPGPGGWGSIIVTPAGEVTELGGRDPQTTNNRMELAAVIAALDFLGDVQDEVVVYTDSTYVIRGINQWIWAWRKRDWKNSEGNEVANSDLWQQLLGVVGRRKKHGEVTWKYVRGHSGVPGNERVDEIAVAFSKAQRPALYRGPLLKYAVPVLDLPEDVPLPEMKPKAAKTQAHSYLSLVNGTPERHSNWPDCERRVKGRSGAKFKKATSAQEEGEILASWGFSPEDVGSSR